MAYTFSQINQAISQGQDQKADIFANSMANQPQQQAGAPMAGQEKVSTEGDLSSSKATGAVPSYEPQRAGASIAKKQIGRQLPGFMTQAQGQIQSAQQNLQNEANAYVQNARSQQYGVGQDILDKVGQGDQEAYNQVATRLSQSGPQVQAFQPKTDTSLRDVSKLQTDEGVKDYLRKQSKGQYSSGESALDLSIMKRNPQFNLIREELRRGQQSLQEQAGKEAEARTKEAEEIAAQRYAQDTEAIKRSLGAQSESIQSQLAKRAAEENAARQQQEAFENRLLFEAQQAAEARRELAGQTYIDAAGRVRSFGENPKTAAIDPAAYIAQQKAFMSEKGITPEDYYRGNQGELSQYYRGGGQISPEQLATAQEAQIFNNIMNLLGKTNRLSEGGQAGGRSFDKAAYQQFLRSDVEKREAEAKSTAESVIEKAKKFGVVDKPTSNQYKSGEYVSKADLEKAYKTIGRVMPDKYR